MHEDAWKKGFFLLLLLKNLYNFFQTCFIFVHILLMVFHKKKTKSKIKMKMNFCWLNERKQQQQQQNFTEKLINKNVFFSFILCSISAKKRKIKWMNGITTTTTKLLFSWFHSGKKPKKNIYTMKKNSHLSWFIFVRYMVAVIAIL